MTPTFFAMSPQTIGCQAYSQFSPLVLADRLISLAQEADRAGLTASASRLIGLVYAVLDDEGKQQIAA